MMKAAAHETRITGGGMANQYNLQTEILPLKRFLIFAVLVVAPSARAADTPPLPRPLVSGLKKPSAVAVGPQGKVYVATQGQASGDGEILLLDNGKAVPFARGLDNPQA